MEYQMRISCICGYRLLLDEDICASVHQDTDSQPDSKDETSEDPLPKSRDAILALCTLRAQTSVLSTR